MSPSDLKTPENPAWLTQELPLDVAGKWIMGSTSPFQNTKETSTYNKNTNAQQCKNPNQLVHWKGN